MKYRKLRIVWSVVCGIACLLLIVLWVRSYWWWDYAFKARRTWARVLEAQSFQGHLLAASALGLADKTFGVGIVELEPNLGLATWEIKPCLGFYLGQVGGRTLIIIPHWFTLLCAGFTAAVPWLPWRFSLRTLLIATTLIAVGLGFAGYLFRR